MCLIKPQSTYNAIKKLHETATNRNFAEDYKKVYTPTNFFQKTLLGVGSGVAAILNPRRGDMVACMGEVTGREACIYMKSKMENSEEGLRILKDQPRINSRTVDLEWLKTLPENTLGKLYSDFLVNHKLSPDERPAVQFVDEVDLAYVMQRYREVHDMFHSVLGMPINLLGEVTVKWIEAIQTRLPMCITGALFGPVRLKTKHRALYLNHYLPWAIRTGYDMDFLMNIYFEKRWEQPIHELQQEVKMTPLILPKQ